MVSLRRVQRSSAKSTCGGRGIKVSHAAASGHPRLNTAAIPRDGLVTLVRPVPTGERCALALGRRKGHLHGNVSSARRAMGLGAELSIRRAPLGSPDPASSRENRCRKSRVHHAPRGPPEKKPRHIARPTLVSKLVRSNGRRGLCGGVNRGQANERATPMPAPDGCSTSRAERQVIDPVEPSVKSRTRPAFTPSSRRAAGSVFPADSRANPSRSSGLSRDRGV